ncbi:MULTISPECIES: hypothetical protein [Bacillaceae]|uniref:hypothetical protein n=1 Tax=Bacillaceae TaxID=186817 RepID=UPI0015F4FAAD|nr:MULTISPECIES: hypothetical protein [Bacillaceae]MCE4051875.1 hypothetical protein [Bacillus sp. Au-Bac7]
MSMADIIRSMFEGYKSSPAFQERQHKRKFDELNHTPFLFSDKYLKELYLELDTREDYETLINYMDRFNLSGNGYAFCDKLYEHTTDEYEDMLTKKKKKKDDDWLDWV